MSWTLPRLALAILAGIVVLVVGFTLIFNFDPFHRRARAEAKAAAATTQAAVSQVATQAVDHYTDHVTIIREKADHAVQQIQHAPTADQPLDPGFRATLCAQLDSVRGGSVCADDHATNDLPGSL